MGTPECPGCGAKFSHDTARQMCKKCGLPDEIAAMGLDMVTRWKKHEARQAGATNSQLKAKFNPHGPRRRNKHGRKGVRR